jgi:V8-like Glu-specific endopeptidase
LNGNGTRVRYTTTTEPGSSGSPCFGPDWQWVAIHHSGDPKYWAGGKPAFNEGIPASAIRRLLTERGKAGLLGGPA